MRKTLKEITIAILIVVNVVGLVVYANYLKEQGAFDPILTECGKVVQTRTIDQQYGDKWSYGIAKMGSGLYKSFQVAKFVVESDTVCQDGDGWLKKNDYLKNFTGVKLK